MPVILCILLLIACSSNNKVQELESFLNFDGNRVHYKSGGKGQEVILVHDGYLDLDMWNPQMDVLGQGRKTIRFSDLGHGLTESSGSEVLGYKIIEHLSQASESEPAILIGLSWGAMISVDYVLNNPKKVSKLILVSPGLNGWDYFQDSIAAKNNLLRQEATTKNNIKEAAALFHRNWVIGPRRNEKDLSIDFHKTSLKMINKTMKNHWKEDWSQLDSIPAIGRLEEIEVPTYIIIGDQDAEDIKAIAEEYDRRIPNSGKIVVEGGAHILNMEKPEEFNHILVRILAE